MTQQKRLRHVLKHQNHVPCSFAYKVVYVDNKFSKNIVLYRGKDAFYEFIKSILTEYNYCRSVVKTHFNKNLIMNAEENERFELTNICWICSKLIENSDHKIRDHCHTSEKYRGAAHWSCNINLKITKKVPVIFHNLKGYDSHLIFEELSKSNVKISVIPNGLEKYMGFTINKNLVFVDSMQFMNSSPDKLVKNLNDKDFRYLSEEFSDEQLKLVREKGIYPYEYMNSFKRFSEDEVPNKSKFFSSLKDSGVNEKEYKKVVNDWKVFKIKSLGEYHDLYLKTDVLLSVDVFEKFVETCLNYYRLDPCHYFISPGLSWDVMLEMTKIKLELISNVNMHLFIEKGKGSGISYICKRHSVSDGEKRFTMYWDENNLYGWAMNQPLPHCDFHFLTKK